MGRGVVVFILLIIKNGIPYNLGGVELKMYYRINFNFSLINY